MMRNPLSRLIALLALFLALPASASYPLISTTTIAGSGAGADAVNGLAQDASGNLYAAGYLTQGSGSDIWVAKFSPSLVLLSSYTYDKAGFSDIAWAVDVDTAGGGVFVAGVVASSATYAGDDIWVAKFDSSLVLISSLSVNGPGNNRDVAGRLRVSGGSVYVVGRTSETIGAASWVARYDTNLVLLSSASLIQFEPYGFEVLPSSSGSVFAAGSRAPDAATSVDAWIGKFDSNLVLVASAALNGSASNTDQYHRLVDDGAGGVYAVGYLNTATAADRFIIHYDSNLVLVSSSLVNGPGNSNEYLTDIFWTSTGTLLVAGDISDTGGNGGINAFIAEYQADLTLLSSTTHRGGGSGADHAYSIVLGVNKDLYAGGWATEATQDAWLARFSTNPAYFVYPGCAVTNSVGAGQTYATIQSAVDALPSSLPGHSCVVIRDGATYAEQVTVRNFTLNGSSISIFADPGSGLTPVVSPPAASTAAFLLATASVSVRGINILGTNSVTYGILASSDSVTISSVNIDSGGKISLAGAQLLNSSQLTFSSITVQLAHGLRLNGSNNLVADSTMTSNGGGYSALLINATSSNTVTRSYLANPSGDGLTLSGAHNTISRSTMTSAIGGYAALFLSGASYNTLTQSVITNTAGNATSIFSSAHNTISQSVLTSAGAANYALYLFSSSSNTIAQSYVANPSGRGAYLFNNSNYNTISQSTLTNNTAGYASLHFEGGVSNSVISSYIEGSTAVYVSGSTSTVINSSVLVATNTLGTALVLRGGGVGLSVESSTLQGGASGRGLLLELGGSGVVSVGSVTVTGSARGLEISTQAAGFSLAIDSITFRALSPGATAIHFLGGTFVSTVTLAIFEDASVEANVSGEALDLASRLTMRGHRGPRRGAAYENDPNAVVEWIDVVTAPAGLTAVALSTTSVQWSWLDNSDDELGFRLLAGTVSVSGDLPANSTAWLQAGMGVNTSSGAMLVQAFTATVTGDSGLVTRYSLADAPSALAASNIFLSSATLNWSANNPGGTLFELERSTGAGFSLLLSTTAAAYTDTSIGAGSTYYYRVRALNGDAAATAYSSSATVNTMGAAPPAAPSAFAGVAQSSATILWTWTDNSSDETGFRVKRGTVNASGDLAANAVSWLQTGLMANTTSGVLLAQAFNSTGTADSSSLERYTLADAPSGLATASVFQTSVTLTWTSLNPSGTLFALERSTGGPFVLASSVTATVFTDTGLTHSSTYFYRVRAVNAEAITTAYSATVSTVTEMTLLPGAPTSFAGVALSTESILWSWTDNAGNEDGFRVLSGTISLSGDLAINATTWLQTSLGANAVSGPLAAQAFNGAGAVVSSTATRTTWAAAPSELIASGVYQTSATLSWNAGGNPGGTVYELEISTGAAFTLLYTGTTTAHFDGFLTPSATHFYRVRAYSAESIVTAYSSSISVVAVPAPPVPASAGTPVGAALGISSVSWTWVLASGATNHFLYRAADNSYLGTSLAGPFVQTALSPNMPYGLRAAGVNVGGVGPLSPSATVYTFAALPSNTTVSSITASSLIPGWGLNGNPATTVAEIERSTNAVAYSTLSAGAFTSYADAGLLGCTTYYYRVRNLNGNGFATAYSTFAGVTGNTLASPPAGLTATANAGGTVSLGWGLSATEGVTGYRLYWDAGTGTVSYAAPIAVLASTDTTFTTGVLSSSSSYTFSLRTAHRCGTVETTGALAMSGAAVAPAAVRAVIKEPDSGKRIYGNRITLLGELIAGTPSEVQEIRFQYKLAASTAWANIPSALTENPNPDYSFPYFTHWDVTAPALTGAYDLRAVAYARNGVPDSAPPAVRVVIDAVTPEIVENAVGGAISKAQEISNVVTSVVETCGPGATDPAVRVSIPPGAVTSASATVTVIANPAITTAAPTGHALVGSAIKIDLSNGQSALNGTATITLTYPETVRYPSLLQLYYLNEITGQWSRDFTSTVNTASRTVTGNTPHFSTFALMLGSAFFADLDSVQVYPVPFKPNGQNPNEGRTYSEGDPNSGIIFAHLAMGTAIKIYTMTGRLVASLDNTPITGTIRWDARNQDGRDVASGAYFAVITSGGHKAVVKKLVIIR